MPASTWQQQLADDRLVNAVRGAKSVAVLTGAGISAESGIPTFRGNEGLWKQFRPEDLANFDAFIANPTLVWEWYQFRRQVVDKAIPNAGHRALAAWEAKVADFTLTTQNVDGLHARAGSRNLIELHGNLNRDRCIDCGQIFGREIELNGEALPLCACGGQLRPDVVWFGELLPEDAMDRSVEAAWRCDIFLSVGTSAVVQPAASLPTAAKRHGAVLIEVNPEPTPLSSYATYTLYAPAGEALPALVELLDR